MANIPGYKQTERSSTLAPAAAAEVEEDIIFPAMPTTIKAQIIKQAHREKTWKEPVFNAMVARPVTKKGMESTSRIGSHRKGMGRSPDKENLG